jgi:hypothetical protein
LSWTSTSTIGSRASGSCSPCAIKVNITADEDARKKMHELRAHNPTNTVQLDQSRMPQGASWLKEYWAWVQSATSTPVEQILRQVTKLDG